MPFKSKAQWRACFAKNDPKWPCHEWAHETKKSFKKLPEKKNDDEKIKKAGLLLGLGGIKEAGLYDKIKDWMGRWIKVPMGLAGRLSNDGNIAKNMKKLQRELRPPVAMAERFEKEYSALNRGDQKEMATINPAANTSATYLNMGGKKDLKQ